MARNTLLGLGAAVAAVGAAAAGAAIDRHNRLRPAQPDLDPQEGYALVGDEILEVTADDGVTLHVEVDLPRDEHDVRQPVDPSKPTVVFSHGYTLTSASWVFQRRALARAGFRCVAWDQRSHGASGESDREHSTIEQLGRDLRAVIAAAAPTGPLVLVGHSMGGMTTMSYARQFSGELHERVLAVALVATSAGGGGLTHVGLGEFVGALVGRAGPGVLDRLARYPGAFGAVRRAARDVEEALVARWSFDSPVPRDLVRFAADTIFTTPLQVMAAFLPALEGLDEAAALASFHGIETLVINGDGDLLTPPEHSDGIVRGIPGAEHVVIEHAGHLVMLEHPEIVNEQLFALIARGVRAHDTGTPVPSTPRVLRTVTDLRRGRVPARRVQRARARTAS